jgi:hypothetical protein
MTDKRTDKKKRPANPYTQAIVPQVVKTGEEVKKSEPENDKATKPQNEKTIEREPDTATLRHDYAALQLQKEEPKDKPQPEGEARKDGQVVDEPKPEKATIQVNLYLTQTLDDKLYDLRQEYKKRTGGKKIKPNEIMRKLIEKAKIEDIL